MEKVFSRSSPTSDPMWEQLASDQRRWWVLQNNGLEKASAFSKKTHKCMAPYLSSPIHGTSMTFCCITHENDLQSRPANNWSTYKQHRIWTQVKDLHVSYIYISIYMYAYLYIHNYIYNLYVEWFLWNLIMSWLTCLAQSNLSLFPSTRSCKQSIFCTDWWKAKPRWSDAWEDMFGGPQSQWRFISKIQQSMQWNPSGTASAQSRLERGRKLTDGRWRLRLWNTLNPKDWEHIWKRWLQGL